LIPNEHFSEDTMSASEIDIEGAKQHLDAKSADFVDIRDPGSYAEAHVPGAIRLDDRSVGPFLQSSDKSRPLIIYCYHGNSSLSGAAFFRSQGFTEVYSMAGGFEAWRSRYDFEPGDDS